MVKFECNECKHCSHGGCIYDFRWAAGDAGQQVDNCDDVYFCHDFDEVEEEGEEE